MTKTTNPVVQNNNHEKRVNDYWSNDICTSDDTDAKLYQISTIQYSSPNTKHLTLFW